MAETKIQTDLIGAAVVFNRTPGYRIPKPSVIGKHGRIRSVYVTPEGPKLTVQLEGNGCADDGELVEVWTGSVTVRG